MVLVLPLPLRETKGFKRAFDGVLRGGRGSGARGGAAAAAGEPGERERDRRTRGWTFRLDLAIPSAAEHCSPCDAGEPSISRAATADAAEEGGLSSFQRGRRG